MRVQFVTTNPGKVREATACLDGVAAVEQLDYDYAEVQSDDFAEIAAAGAEEAVAAAGGGPVIVDDSGLSIAGLNGFPGPYSSYVEETLGVERVWHLARELDDRAASFTCAIAYVDGETTATFTGSVEGRIVAPRGDGGFGFDPIFAVDGETYAEMSPDAKNALSHRGRALEALADWLADGEE